MAIVTKPYGDFVNNVDVADANKVNAQINTLYTGVNGGLDYNNVPSLGNPANLQTTAQDTLVNAINEVNTKGTVDFMSRQGIINGNFDVWQRGTSFTNPASGTYMADHWKTLNATDGGTFPNVTHSQQALTPGDIPGAYYYHRTNVDGAGSSLGINADYDIRQLIERGTRYLCGANKKVTVSFWARSSISNKRIGIGAIQNYGTGGTPSAQEFLLGTIFNLTSTWQKFTFTFTTNTLVGKTFGTNNDDWLGILFFYVWGTTTASQRFGGGTAETFGGAGNIDIAQVQLNAGDQALPFQPRSFAEELALCQRYYEKSYDYALSPGSVASTPGIYHNIGSPSSATSIAMSGNFKVAKRVAPTVTVYDMNGASGKISSWNGSAQTNGITVTPDQISQTRFRVLASVTSGNYEIFGHYAADAEL